MNGTFVTIFTFLLLILPICISGWICLLNENDSDSSSSSSSSPKVLNIFDIDTSSEDSINSTCCRIRLTNSSSSYQNSLCFTESTDNFNRLRTIFKVSGKFYPSFKTSPLSPVNAVCMKGELISCQEMTFNQIDDVDGQLTDAEKALLKSTKHRRKPVFEGYSDNESVNDDLNDENNANNNIDTDQTVSDQSYQEITIVTPSPPNLSTGNDLVQVEYVIGEEVKLACLLETKQSNQIVWVKDNDYLLTSPSSSQLINDIDYQIIHNPINSLITLDILMITINSGNASGLYTCYSNNLTAINSDQVDSMSFQVIATSSREYAEYKFKSPNITGFIVGMIPSIMLFFYIIMSLGYRSRYAMDQEEEEEGLGI